MAVAGDIKLDQKFYTRLNFAKKKFNDLKIKQLNVVWFALLNKYSKIAFKFIYRIRPNIKEQIQKKQYIAPVMAKLEKLLGC